MSGGPKVEKGQRVVALGFGLIGNERHLGEQGVVTNSNHGSTNEIGVRFEGDVIDRAVTSWRLVDSPYRPTKGDWVRIKGMELEGVVRVAYRGIGCSVVDFGDNEMGTFKNERLERLPDPEPKFEPGDAVLDADGRTFIRSGDDEWPWIGRRSDGRADRYGERSPQRPLTRLTSDGKPVGGAQ